MAGAALLAAMGCALSEGCAAKPPRPKVPDPAWIIRRANPRFDEPLDVPRLARALAQYRGIAMSEELHVERHGGDRIRAELTPAPWSRPDVDGFWHAFGLAPSNDAVGARLGPMLAAGVSG